MNTTIKEGVPSKKRYSLVDLTNEAELLALFDRVEGALRDCDRCGTHNGRLGYYFTPDENAPHHFAVCCLGEGCCQMQTPWDSAEDTEESVKRALQFVYTVWNRTKDDPGPNWLF